MAVFVAYRIVYDRLFPPPLPAPVTTAPAGEPAPATAAVESATSGPAQAATARGEGYRFSAAEQVETVVLGGGPDDRLEIQLTSSGAAIETIRLTEKKPDGQYVHRRYARGNEPYLVIQPVPTPDGPHASYLTPWVRLGKTEWPLDGVVWQVAQRSAHAVTFATTLCSVADDRQHLRLTKTYTLAPGSAVATLRVTMENVSDEPLELALAQDGPVGVVRESQQYEMRKLVAGSWEDGRVDTRAYGRADLKKLPRFGSSQTGFLWTALANKYFAVFTRPLARQGLVADFVEGVVGSTVLPDGAEEDPGDYLARIITVARPVAPGETAEYTFEIHAGTKNENDLERVNPAYADRSQLGYVAARDADTRCCLPLCTFPFLTSFMTWLLEIIQELVRNYGVAIIVVVVIVRALLHPLAVFQQKSMYRMQEAQALLQPKLAALKEKYANDRVRLNQETMKLYSEEGVNPMAGMVGMLPMLIQMPILVALWTALNTDVHLRHAAFLPWWITDLSAPDAVVEFARPITIPVLGWLPLIGRMFSDIPSINLLPLLMGVSMWLQQKYMPKPAMQARLEAARRAAAEKKPHERRAGLSPEEQARQQQMIMNVMSVVFPLMFYYMPSGLNLYWMATNVFGIFESLRIRKQIEAEKQRRQAAGPAPGRRPGRPGLVGRILRRMAQQAEELQKKADALSREEAARRNTRRDRKPGKTS